MKVNLAGTALLALGVLVVGCGGGGSSSDAADAPTGPASADVFGIHGEIRTPLSYGSVMSKKHIYLGDPCRPPDGYDDVHEGAQVTVRDGDGSTVAIGELGAGVLAGKEGQSVLRARCSFTFDVPSVPAGSRFYSIEVAHRGEVTYSEGDLQDDVTLNLGD